MQTIYCTTANITSSRSKIVDLDAYRRQLVPQDRGALRFDAPDQAEESSRARRPHRRAGASSLVLEALASMSVVVMTLTFTVQLLIG